MGTFINFNDIKAELYEPTFEVAASQTESVFKSIMQYDSSKVYGETTSVDITIDNNKYLNPVDNFYANTDYSVSQVSRRWATFLPYSDYQLVSMEEWMYSVRHDPVSDVTTKLINQYNRMLDKIAIDTLLGPSKEGRSAVGASTVNFPASQRIAAGGTGMTMAKIANAKRILAENEWVINSKTVNYFLVCNPKCYTQLLMEANNKMGSIMFFDSKPYVTGELPAMLGLTAIYQSNIITEYTGDSASATNRPAILFCANAGTLYDKGGMNVSILPASDKQHNISIGIKALMTGMRKFDTAVVDMRCDETV